MIQDKADGGSGGADVTLRWTLQGLGGNLWLPAVYNEPSRSCWLYEGSKKTAKAEGRRNESQKNITRLPFMLRIHNQKSKNIFSFFHGGFR